MIPGTIWWRDTTVWGYGLPMTETQQYRVVADRDKGDDPQWDDVRVNDRVLTTPARMSGGEVTQTSSRTTTTAASAMTVDVLRIYRPVPTTDEPMPGPGVVQIERVLRSPHAPSPHPPTREQIAEEEDRIRRDERMRWAIYLWGMDEDTDEPEGAFEEGADMAYHAVAAWLLANIAHGFNVADMAWLDPELVEDAKRKARLLPAHPDSEVHEVDRCIAVLALIQNGADR